MNLWASSQSTRWRSAVRFALWLPLLQLLGGACSKEEVVLGEQCPSPDNPTATVERGPLDMDAGAPLIYGTSCAPAMPASCADAQPRLDPRGCIVYVTFESCGGDICVGRTRLSRLIPDAGDSDGGAESDGGDSSAREDAGAGS